MNILWLGLGGLLAGALAYGVHHHQTASSDGASLDHLIALFSGDATELAAMPLAMRQQHVTEANNLLARGLGDPQKLQQLRTALNANGPRLLLAP